MARNKKIKGLGDVIASVTTAVGIEPCDSCNKRKEKLNELFPFEIEDFTETEKEYLGTFFESDKQEQTKELLDIYFRVFKVKTFDIAPNSPGVYNSIIKKLKKAYNNA